MEGKTPFALSIKDLTSLDQDLSVEFFRRLLWAEASRVGIGRILIDVPQCINVGDGGIDAYIKNAKPSSEELIPLGTTGFQIKSRDLNPSGCRKELHKKEDLSKPIKPEIKRIMDEGGSYILVLLDEITTQKKRSREEAIKDELKKIGYPDAKVRVYSANQLACFAEQFLALIAWLEGGITLGIPYSSWAERHDIKVPKNFICDNERRKIIEDINYKLRNPDGACQIFRIVGLPGIGKTRIVYEALSQDDFKNHIIYVSANQFQLSNLHIILQNDQNLSAIVVIDECDLHQHEDFVRSYSGRGSRLAVFTISHEIRKTPPPTMLYELSILEKKSIEKIISSETPQLPEDVITRLSKFADGYPRIAVLLAESYLKNKGATEEFLMITDEALMDRLIGAGIDTKSDYFRKTKKVLTGLSLFEKIGFKGKVSREAKWLAQYFIIDWDDFTNIVSEQKQRGIIQGEFFIYVTPFMLRIHLLRGWWESKGFTPESFEKFIDNIPEEFRSDLIQRFLNHIPYITITDRGKEFIKKILGKQGFFANGTLLKNPLGAEFFEKLAEADPSSALESLKDTFGNWNKEELLHFKNGRRNVIWALEKIAMWRELFKDAARLLINLGEAENETYSNNASGVFVELFSPAPAPIAPTEASPQERFPVLKEALESKSKEKRLLALLACDKALESGYFSRTMGAEEQGLRREPKLWMPKTYGEIFESYRRVWKLLYEKLDDMTDDEREKALEIILRRAGSLSLYQSLSDMVVETIDELSKKACLNKKQILEGVIQILRYTGKQMPKKIRQQWTKMRDQLTGSDFPSLLNRYVGMALIEDRFDEQGNRIDQTQYKIEKLADESIKKTSLLTTELAWLVTKEAKNGYGFGYELGKRDKNFLLLSKILKAQRIAGENATTNFLGGYLKAMFEMDPIKWEKQLDILASDKKLMSLIPELTWRSGFSDEAAIRVLSLAEKKLIGTKHFSIFSFGDFIRNISEKIFIKWIQFLLDRSDYDAISIALDIFYSYYIYGKLKPLFPKELTLKLLLHPLLFEKSEEVRRDQMVGYHWTEIGKVFLKRYPEESLKIADKILENFGNEGNILNGIHAKRESLIDEIVKIFPGEAWKKVKKYLGPPIDSRALHIKNWLQQSELLSFIPIKEIWKWIDLDVEKRARYFASFVPKTLSREKGKACLAREILVSYGTRADVKSSLMANFSTEFWSGRASAHYQSKRNRLLKFKKNENNENVKHWINEYVSQIEAMIERSKIEEEKEGF